MITKLTSEQTENAKIVYEEIQKIEEQHNSNVRRTIKDIEDCYVDDYILSIWKSEGKYNEETGEGWNTFEDFLVSFITQNIELER